VRCTLDTGRTHQIRVHLTAIGHPLVGDPVYGARRSAIGLAPFARQALHAHRLGYVHPVTRRALAFESALPADLSALLDGLRAGSR
jgi:23S rRNA pseudouridine1911/1915/1917 synthase